MKGRGRWIIGGLLALAAIIFLVRDILPRREVAVRGEDTVGRLGEGQLWIDDNPALTVTEIRSKARRLQDRLDTPLGLIVVDYLQLMSAFL
mgnify:CR=1 FL=1